MTTSEYCPARLGASESVWPRAPWHMVQLSARVAPRPTESVFEGVAIDLSSTTSVEVESAFPPDAALQVVGTPAARQMVAQSPSAEKSGWTEGSHTKPTSSDTKVRTASDRTLQRNQALLQENMPSSLCIT